MTVEPKDLEHVLVEVYDKGGQYAVYDWVRENHPEWPDEWCIDCEDDTPTWDGVCAVCFTVRVDKAV